MPSVLAVLGVPGAVDAARAWPPALAGVRRIAVLLVDGLGRHQIPAAAPYAPTLADLAAAGRAARQLTAGFPSTTPTSLVTLGTGAAPGAHGVLGFKVRRPRHRPGAQPHPLGATTRTRRAGSRCRRRSSGPRARRRRGHRGRAGPSSRGSGLTVAANRGGDYRRRRRRRRARRGRCSPRSPPAPGPAWSTATTPTWTGTATSSASTRAQWRGSRPPTSTGCWPGWSTGCRRTPRCWSPPTTASSTCRPTAGSTSTPTRGCGPGCGWSPASRGCATCTPCPGAVDDVLAAWRRCSATAAWVADPGGGDRRRLVRPGAASAHLAPDRRRGGGLPRRLRGASPPRSEPPIGGEAGRVPRLVHRGRRC